MDLAVSVRMELSLVEHHMPELMACRELFELANRARINIHGSCFSIQAHCVSREVCACPAVQLVEPQRSFALPDWRALWDTSGPWRHGYGIVHSARYGACSVQAQGILTCWTRSARTHGVPWRVCACPVVPPLNIDSPLYISFQTGVLTKTPQAICATVLWGFVTTTELLANVCLLTLWRDANRRRSALKRRRPTCLILTSPFKLACSLRHSKHPYCSAKCVM